MGAPVAALLHGYRPASCPVRNHLGTARVGCPAACAALHRRAPVAAAAGDRAGCRCLRKPVPSGAVVPHGHRRQSAALRAPSAHRTRHAAAADGRAVDDLRGPASWLLRPEPLRPQLPRRDRLQSRPVSGRWRGPFPAPCCFLHRSPPMSLATATPAKALLSPADHALILIDYQSQMAFATHTIDISALRNNVSLISKGAKGFKVPVLLTTVAEKSFSGPMFPELPAIFPGQAVFDRTSMNTWEDQPVIDEVNRIGKRRLVLAGLWTSVCIVGPALSALEQGFEVYVITDACGDVSEEVHERAIARMVQAGAVPITSVQYLLELQRDWARAETYDLTTGIARDHAGGYGVGIQYAKTMFGAQEG